MCKKIPAGVRFSKEDNMYECKGAMQLVYYEKLIYLHCSFLPEDIYELVIHVQTV